VKAAWVGFGEIEIEGRRYEHDLVIDRGKVAKRHKKPSRPYRARFGHTPLSAGETIPWGGGQLIVGTGASGSLPIMTEVWREAERRHIEIVALPTGQALELVSETAPKDVRAIIHVTC